MTFTRPLIEYFGHTRVEIRMYAKSELAEALKISRNTLWKYLKEIRPEIEEKVPNYNFRAHTLKPQEIRIFLTRYGWI